MNPVRKFTMTLNSSIKIFAVSKGLVNRQDVF